MGVLPDEVVIDILLLLPIKSLMRFRCVNKTWLQLLTNPHPQFAQSYLTKSNKKTSTILALGMENFQDKPNIYSAVELNLACDKSINLELPFSAKSYSVDGIRNGLILLRLEDDKDKFFVWNPFTNDYIHIPSPPSPSSDHFNCCDKITNTGFGFLQATNQFKIISFSECKYTSFHPNSHVSVYTLASNSCSSWRNLRDISYHTFSIDCAAPLVNGVLHWTAFIGCTYLDTKRIVSFDMNDEIFREIPYPKAIYQPNFYDRVGELGGLLCILGRDCGENVEVWVMQEYGVANSWNKLFTIGRPDICGSFASLRPIGVGHNGEILRTTTILIKTITLDVFLYCTETKSVRNLKEFGLPLYEAYAYTPSFLSPRAIIGAGGLLAVQRAACTYTPSHKSPRPVHRGRELLEIRRSAYKRNGSRRLSAKKIRDSSKIRPVTYSDLTQRYGPFIGKEIHDSSKILPVTTQR